MVHYRSWDHEMMLRQRTLPAESTRRHGVKELLDTFPPADLMIKILFSAFFKFWNPEEWRKRKAEGAGAKEANALKKPTWPPTHKRCVSFRDVHPCRELRVWRSGGDVRPRRASKRWLVLARLSTRRDIWRCRETFDRQTCVSCVLQCLAVMRGCLAGREEMKT